MDLVTGVSGQDGSFLAELLLAAGRRVIGLVPPGEIPPPWLPGIQQQGLGLHACDLADPVGFRHLLREFKPERVYHCAAVSLPAAAAAEPASSRVVNVTSAEVLCDWLRRDAHGSRLLLVSSSAVFGPCREGVPHCEDSPSLPQGEYARQKPRCVNWRARRGWPVSSAPALSLSTMRANGAVTTSCRPRSAAALCVLRLANSKSSSLVI
jgi:GDPmannose 4,6-dehydratase